MLKKISKLNKPLRGKITIPADKSISHRAVMFSSIAQGECIVRNFSSGADCHSTLNLFKGLGVSIEFLDDKTLKISSDGVLKAPNCVCDCGNSGTTMRLVSGILAGQDFNSVLVGDKSLSKRPMKRVIEPLSLMGANIESIDWHAPLKIFGTKLKGIDYNSKLASAQVKSCILLAGLNAEGVTSFTEPYVSRDHTERLFSYLGTDIETKNTTVTVKPSQLIAKDIDVVGDISSAAFFIVAGLIVKGSDFIIKNVGINTTRSGILDVVKRMGGGVEILNERVVSGEPCADLRIQYNDNLQGCVIEGSDIPRLIDELPVIAVLASQAEGETFVKNAEDLRNKESDRIKCLVNELSKIGIDIKETSDGFIVVGKNTLAQKPVKSELECYHDHRLAMSFFVAGLLCENEIAINGFEWTKISFPEFEELFAKLK